MELRIVPTSDMVINFQGKAIGKLDALVLDASKTSMLGIPSVKIAISLDGNQFEDKKVLSALIDKIGKFKFLDILVRNVKKA